MSIFNSSMFLRQDFLNRASVCFFLITCFLILKPSLLEAQSPVVYSVPGNYTWTVPPCVTQITVQVWGGGGGGGSVWSRFNSVSGNGANCEQGDEICATAGGGGGGGFASRTYTVVPGQVYNITVGAGGVASVNSSGENRANNGGNGGNSTFSGPATVGPGTLTGFGGNGGGAANIVRSCNFGCDFNHDGANGAGGTGGGGANGTVTHTGGNGASGVHSSSTNDKSGGGGGGAGTNANGTNGGLIAAGVGGNADGGNGGSGINQPYGNGFFGTNGNPGLTIGGGGGGAASHNRNSCNSSGNNHQSRVGGDGARGEVRITYSVGSQPTPLFDPVSPICSGDNLSPLPTTSSNGIIGTWSPVLNNTSTTTYTFTPDPSNCANTTTLTITVNQPTTTPNFDQVAPVCSGTALQPLPTTSSNGINGIWSPAINNLTTTTYTFTPSSGQCALSATMTITINSATVPSFDPVGPYCTGTTIDPLPTFSNENISGTWSPVINNSTTTTYTFTPTSGQCATNTQLTVNVGPPVTPTFATIPPVCVGTTVNPLPLVSQESISGAWSPSFNSNNSGVYTFTPNADQCANTATISVTVNQLLSPIFQQIPAICQGDQLSPIPTTSTNNITGSWNPPVDNTQTTTYTFTPDAGQCAATTTMSINVNSLSQVPLFDPVPDVCQNTVSPVLAAISNNGIQGSWSPSVSTTNAGTSTYTFTPDAGQCGTTATIDITVIDAITPVFDPLDPVCVNSSPPLLVSPSNNGVSGTWNAQISTSAAGSQTYIFTPASSQCATTTSISITINPNPIVDAGVDQIVCVGEDVVLNGSGAVTYNWSNAVINGVPFSAGLGTTNYTVTGTDVNGCTSSDIVNVVANPVPIVSAGNDLVICEGEQVTLIGSGANVYTWNNNVSNSVSFTPAVGDVTYTVTGTNNFGCTATDNMQLTVNDTPTALFQFDGVGCIPFDVQLESVSSTGNCFWELSNGETFSGCSVFTTLTVPGCYDVTLTVENNGCSSSFTALNVLCAQELPVADFGYQPSQITTLDTEVGFSNYSEGAVTYEWFYGDGGSSTEFEPSHEFPFENAGEYEVVLVATSSAGCVDTAVSIIVIDEELIFYVPNTFTPDDDSYNPVFTPVFTSGFDPYDYHLTIFNRWGEIVFESYNHEVGWDGTYGISTEKFICQDDVYTWRIQYKLLKNDSSAEVVGHVNLLR